MSEFRPLKSFPAYEISLEENKDDVGYPYKIRNIKTQHVIKPLLDKRYIYVSLYCKPVLYHRVLYIEGLIKQPDNFDTSKKYEIDHINRNRHDNRLNNLRCVDRSENIRNKNKFNKIDELPQKTYMVTGYNGKHTFKPCSYFYNPETNTMYRQLKNEKTRYKQLCDFRLYDDKRKCGFICHPQLLEVIYRGKITLVKDVPAHDEDIIEEESETKYEE